MLGVSVQHGANLGGVRRANTPAGRADLAIAPLNFQEAIHLLMQVKDQMGPVRDQQSVNSGMNITK